MIANATECQTRGNPSQLPTTKRQICIIPHSALSNPLLVLLLPHLFLCAFELSTLYKPHWLFIRTARRADRRIHRIDIPVEDMCVLRRAALKGVVPGRLGGEGGSVIGLLGELDFPVEDVHVLGRTALEGLVHGRWGGGGELLAQLIVLAQ